MQRQRGRSGQVHDDLYRLRGGPRPHHDRPAPARQHQPLRPEWQPGLVHRCRHPQDPVQSYDTDDRLLQTIDPAGALTKTQYDAGGNVASRQDADQSLTTYNYDKANRLYSIVTPRGNIAGGTPQNYLTTFGYDPAGNQTSVTDPLNETTKTDYDVLNRPWRVTDAAGNATLTGYDANGNIVSVADPLGDTKTTGFDADNRVSSTTDPRGNVAGVQPATSTPPATATIRTATRTASPPRWDESPPRSTTPTAGRRTPFHLRGKRERGRPGDLHHQGRLRPGRQPEPNNRPAGQHHHVQLRRRRQQDLHDRSARQRRRRPTSRVHHPLRL